MKVKKGTASRVSLAMMPKMRSGSAWNSAPWSRPSSMPTRPNRMPLAASANATGKPNSRKRIMDANISGAMLATTNSVMAPPSPRAAP